MHALNVENQSKRNACDETSSPNSFHALAPQSPLANTVQRINKKESFSCKTDDQNIAPTRESTRALQNGNNCNLSPCSSDEVNLTSPVKIKLEKLLPPADLRKRLFDLRARISQPNRYRSNKVVEPN